MTPELTEVGLRAVSVEVRLLERALSWAVVSERMQLRTRHGLLPWPQCCGGEGPLGDDHFPAAPRDIQIEISGSQ
jgi:hypothetical protein